MHCIAAPVRIRAASYAFGLGLTDKEWRHFASAVEVEGVRADAYHSLPGCGPELIKQIEDTARKGGAPHFNHSGV